MIAACPKCGAKYRVERERVGPEGARLRCAKCQAVFRVRAPESEAAPPAVPEPDILASPAAPDASDRQRFFAPEPPPAPQPQPQLDRECMVLVADSDVETAKNTAAALSSWGLQPVLVHDGVEALLTIQRMLPRAVILDAALPKMYGFQICEMLKRNESLRYIKVVLVGTIYHKGRYHRPPSELYGADVYLEQPDLPDGLIPFMTQFGFELAKTASSMVGEPPDEPMAVAPPPATPSPPASAPVAPDLVAAPPDGVAPPPAAVESAVAPPPTAPSVATEPAPVAGDEFAEERAQAERLARIIVSDIILYEPDKFQAAVLAGNVVEAMDASLGEGRSLFVQRVDARVREEKDFLIEELLRVARERGMQ